MINKDRHKAAAKLAEILAFVMFGILGWVLLFKGSFDPENNSTLLGFICFLCGAHFTSWKDELFADG